MLSLMITVVCILGLMTVFDFKALQTTGSIKAWLLYASLTGVGLAVMGIYLTLFNVPRSPLAYLENWMQPLSRWLSA